MTEEFIQQAFLEMGEPIKGVKTIRDTKTG